jgi:hypothetical protein
MLRFIVLGEIPGTHVDLTFLQIVVLLSVFYGSLWLFREHRFKQRLAIQTIKK